MESHRPVETVTFAMLHARLLDTVKKRIHNGEYTERGLARILGISQPQMHNVLKGARSLRMDLADKILMKLGVSASQLLDIAELESAWLLLREDAKWPRLSPEHELAAGKPLQPFRKPPAAAPRHTNRSRPAHSPINGPSINRTQMNQKTG